jgi:hypothetical protein
MEIYATREGNRLVPIDQVFADELATLPEKTALKLVITKPRSLPHNRLYFAILRAMSQSGANGSASEIHIATKIKCGLYQVVRLPRGEPVVVPDSVAFSKLDQTAFNEFFKRAVAFWKWSSLWEFIPQDLKLQIGE